MNKSKLGTSLWLLLPSKAYEIYFLPFTTILQKLEPSFHLYSYCKDLFYLYCKIPDNFWQGRNIVGSISYKNPVIHSMRINFISIYLEWQVLTSSVCTLQCMMGIDTIFRQNIKWRWKSWLKNRTARDSRSKTVQLSPCCLLNLVYSLNYFSKIFQPPWLIQPARLIKTWE